MLTFTRVLLLALEVVLLPLSLNLVVPLDLVPAEVAVSFSQFIEIQIELSTKKYQLLLPDSPLVDSLPQVSLRTLNSHHQASILPVVLPQDSTRPLDDNCTLKILFREWKKVVPNDDQEIPLAFKGGS